MVSWLLRRRSEYDEHEQPLRTSIADAVRRSFRCDQQDTRLHGKVVAFEQEKSSTFDDLIDLVHAFMGVQRMFLPWLERIQPDHHTLGVEDRTLAHLVR